MAKIWVEAYGCSASFADSEMISGLIVNGGHTLADSAFDSDLNLVVTCSVKDVTANKMIHRIKSLKSKPLVIAGCLPKAERHTVEKFSEKASLLGPNSLRKTLDVVNATLRGKRRVELDDVDSSKVGLPKIRINPAIGIVEISNGCMSECTFCQTKLSKGDLTSYRIGDIVRQVKKEISEGCKEVWLTSTDNGCYGFDIDEDLPSLINSVCEIQEDFKVRVGMMNPMYMPRIRDGLLKSFENDKVFKFLHVPVQSGSDKVLNDMKRGHTVKTFRDVSTKFRKKFPHITISTDVIVGFPTESKEDFEKTVGLIEETKPNIVNLSRYSKRPGTEAAEWEQIQVSEVMRRSKIISDLIERISLENNQKWIGWKGKVLFDERAESSVKGRNFAYKPIFVEDRIGIGEIHTVKITEAKTHSILGKIVS